MHFQVPQRPTGLKARAERAHKGGTTYERLSGGRLPTFSGVVGPGISLRQSNANNKETTTGTAETADSSKRRLSEQQAASESYDVNSGIFYGSLDERSRLSKAKTDIVKSCTEILVDLTQDHILMDDWPKEKLKSLLEYACGKGEMIMPLPSTVVSDPKKPATNWTESAVKIGWKGYSELNSEEKTRFSDAPRRLANLSRAWWAMKLLPTSAYAGKSHALGKSVDEALTDFKFLCDKMDKIPTESLSGAEEPKCEKSRIGGDDNTQQTSRPLTMVVYEARSDEQAVQYGHMRATQEAERERVMAKIALERSTHGFLNDYRRGHSLMQVWPEPASRQQQIVQAVVGSLASYGQYLNPRLRMMPSAPGWKEAASKEDLAKCYEVSAQVTRSMQQAITSKSLGLHATYKEWEDFNKKAEPGHTYCAPEDLPNHPISEAAAAASEKIWNDMVSQAVDIYKVPDRAQSIMDAAMGISEAGEEPATPSREAADDASRTVEDEGTVCVYP